MARLVSFPPGPGRTFTRGPQEQLNVQAGARALRSVLDSFGAARKAKHEQALLSQLLSGQRPTGTRPETREQIIARAVAQTQALGPEPGVPGREFEHVLAQTRAGRGVAMPPKQSVLQRLAAAFRPTGPFTGAQTELERLLGQTQLKMGIEQAKAGPRAAADIQGRVTAMDKEIRSRLTARDALTFRKPKFGEDVDKFNKTQFEAVFNANNVINNLIRERDALAGQIGVGSIQIGPLKELPQTTRAIPRTSTRPGPVAPRRPTVPRGGRAPTTEEVMRLYGLTRPEAEEALRATVER